MVIIEMIIRTLSGALPFLLQSRGHRRDGGHLEAQEQGAPQQHPSQGRVLEGGQNQGQSAPQTHYQEEVDFYVCLFYFVFVCYNWFILFMYVLLSSYLCMFFITLLEIV